jgi:hypothetical protein
LAETFSGSWLQSAMKTVLFAPAPSAASLLVITSPREGWARASAATAIIAE